MPNTHTAIAKVHLSRLEREAAEGRRARNILTRQQKEYDDTVRHIFGLLAAVAPKLSFHAMETIVSLIQAGLAKLLFPDISIKEMLKAAAAARSRQSLQLYTKETAAVFRLAMIADLKEASAVYLGADKGNKGDTDHLAKGVSFFSRRADRVVHYALDVDAPRDGTSEAVAESIDQSIKNNFADGITTLAGQTTDSGGGGSLGSLAQALANKGRTDSDMYLVAPCSLHALQKPLENAIKAAIGEGKIGVRNAMQAVCTCYDAQQHSGDLFQSYWTMANPGAKPPTMMKTPVTTRWWWLITALCHMISRWDEWKHFAKLLMDVSKSDTTPYKVASECYSLLCEPMIKADVHFLGAFGKDIFMDAFDWLQGIDEHAKIFSHRSRNMAEFTFRLITHVKMLESDWQNRPKFETYEKLRSALRSDAVSKQSIKEALFFSKFLQSANKHFRAWLEAPLIACAFCW